MTAQERIERDGGAIIGAIMATSFVAIDRWVMAHTRMLENGRISYPDEHIPYVIRDFMADPSCEGSIGFLPVEYATEPEYPISWTCHLAYVGPGGRILIMDSPDSPQLMQEWGWCGKDADMMASDMLAALREFWRRYVSEAG